MSDTRDTLSLTVLKCSPSPHPSLVSSSASSGHNLTDGLNSPDQALISSSPNKTSPPQNRWMIASHSNKENSRNLKKSSGSRTDSLDSPEVSTRKGKASNMHSNSNKNHRHSAHENILDRAYDKLFRKFRQSKSTCDSDDKSAPSTPQMSTTKEEQVIAELDTVISSHSHYTKNNNGRSKSKERHRSGGWSDSNGGTWPRMHGLQQHDFNTPDGIPNPKRRDRPPLSAISTFVSENPYARGQSLSPVSPQASSSSQSVPFSQQGALAMHGKVPPAPPERGNSSFVASIRHSPQNSDSSIKYVHGVDIARAAASQASKSSPYLISSPTSPVQPNPASGGGNTQQQQSVIAKKVSSLDIDMKNSVRYLTSSHSVGGGGGGGSSIGGGGSLHYQTSSSHTNSVDYSVVSNKDNAVLKHYNNYRKHPRPNSAPSNSRSRIAHAHMIHGTTPVSQDVTPQKPSSLNIQPHQFSRPHSAATSPVDSSLSPTSHPGSSPGIHLQDKHIPYTLISHEKPQYSNSATRFVSLSRC